MNRTRTLLLAAVVGTLVVPGSVAHSASQARDPFTHWRHQHVADGVELYHRVITGRPGADHWTVTVLVDGAHLGTDADARATADRLTAAGLAARVEQVRWPDGADVSGALGSRVRVGEFGGQNQADRQRDAIKAAGFDAVSEWTGGDGVPGTGTAQVKVAVIDPHRYRGELRGSYGTAVAGRELTTDMAAGALLGVNAGFFVMEAVDGVPGASAGIAAYDGRPQSAATNGRVAITLRGNGLRPEFGRMSTRSTVHSGQTVELVDGINRVPGKIRNCGGVGGDQPTERPLHDVTCTDPDEIVAFTPELGVPTPAGPGVEAVLDSAGLVLELRPRGGPVPAGGGVLAGIGSGETWLRAHGKPGATLAVRHVITDEQGREVRLGPGDDIVNGGPRLVRDGRVEIDFRADGIDRPGEPSFPYAWAIKRNPRMVLGVDRRGRILLLTSAGRQPGYSDGLGVAESAELIRSLGAVDAVNLDGGGSTTMVLNGTMITMPSDATGQRAVGDALLLTR
ncbi:phosphodiester glycosidase family protein [Herbihabitans rhizosphaerae]|nr:phosphodiester glycosidase family protein [Herbihabitans rhizosphaerae]